MLPIGTTSNPPGSLRASFDRIPGPRRPEQSCGNRSRSKTSEPSSGPPANHPSSLPKRTRASGPRLPRSAWLRCSLGRSRNSRMCRRRSLRELPSPGAVRAESVGSLGWEAASHYLGNQAGGLPLWPLALDRRASVERSEEPRPAQRISCSHGSSRWPKATCASKGAVARPGAVRLLIVPLSRAERSASGTSISSTATPSM